MQKWPDGCSRSGVRRPVATSCRCTCTGWWRSRARFAIQSFFATIDRYTPQLVSWNGGGFDLPVLHYRGLIHGVHAASYWELGEDDREFRYNNYIGRYHTRHIDLMDLLAMYQPRASAPLDDLARLCGFAGKLGMDGSKVWDAFQAGGIEQIRNYCETDVVNTYLLFTRFQRMRGLLDEAAQAAEELRVEEALRALPQPHWQEYLQAWRA
jgi:predicted PolB exonuclease-like 3'-5' exonuclease